MRLYESLALVVSEKGLYLAVYVCITSWGSCVYTCVFLYEGEGERPLSGCHGRRGSGGECVPAMGRVFRYGSLALYSYH